MQMFFFCFFFECDFFEFLDMVLGQIEFIVYVYFEIDKVILNIYFVENGVLIYFDDIWEFIFFVCSIEIFYVDNVICYFV